MLNDDKDCTSYFDQFWPAVVTGSIGIYWPIMVHIGPCVAKQIRKV